MADVSAYDPVFEAAGNEWNVDPQLLKAMAIQESGGRANAVSPKGALGLMQIMPETAKTLGITDPTDPVQSIYGAAKYMNRALDKEGSVEDALRNYHGGDEWRQAYGPESAAYVPAVTKHYQILGQFKAALADPDPSVRTDGTATAAPAPAAPTGAGKAMASDDPLSLLPPAPKPSAGGGGSTATAAPDDPLSLLPPAPKPAGTAATTTTQETAAPSFADAYAHTQSVDEYGNAQNPLATAPTPPSSLEDLRSQIQAGETNVLRRLSSGPETGPVEDFARHAAGTGVALLSQAAQLPVNILMGITGGASTRNLTINPETGTLNLTSEALAAAQALAGPGAAGRDLRFVPRGGNPLEFVPPARSGGPLPPETAANLLSPDARTRAAETPPGPATPTGIAPPPPLPVPTPAAPVTEHTPWVSATTADIQRVLQENAEVGGPTSLGAMATPEQLAKMTPAQVKANRRVAELNQIVTPIEGEDTTEWVQGSTPTKAERMGTPTESQKERITQERNPDAFEGPNGVRTINDKARVNAFDETLLSDTQAADLKERQQQVASEAQTRILSTAKPVDLKPAADWIEAKLADPLIQEDKHVYNSLKGLRDQLYDADGNLKTDPRAAWGMHNNLRNKLLDAKDPFSANPSEKYAVTQTNEFKGLVDGALDKASDGQFRTHLDQQAEFLKSLNAWRLLNDFRYGPNKMINAKTGMINGNAFHRFVTDLAIRRGRPGIDAAMDVPDNVMQRLINIDQDLKRAARIDLGKPRGSQTNLFFELAGALGISGAHAITAAMTAGTPFGGIANIGVQTGIGAVQRRLGQRRINRLTEQALQPPPGGLTPPPGNPLQQPP